MASNSKNLGELLNTTATVSPAFVSDQDNTSTGYFDLPNGTTAQRPSAASGMIRYNSTLNLAEYHDGTAWKAIDAPPVVTGISPSNFTASGTTITISGSNMQSSATITVIDSDGTVYTPDSITYTSTTSITFDTTTAITNSEKDYFDIKVTNPSGLSATLSDALQISDGTISWNTASGSHSLFESNRAAGFDAGVTLSSGGGESDVTKTFSLSSGTLPSGASLNTSTGAITGISAVGSDTLSNFTIAISAADASSGVTTTDTRSFALTVKAPVITSYTSTGAFTFSVPSGITAVDVLAVAGGGGGGSPYNNAYNGSGGAGAGGLVFRPAFPVTPGGTITGSVGGGGLATAGASAGQHSTPGTPTTFGTLTTIGGGGGGGNDGASLPAPLDLSGQGRTGKQGAPGGSGGAAKNAGEGAGSALQPSQPGDSGTYGFGNGGVTPSTSAFGAGGGGAGGVGQAIGNPFPQGPSGKGGDGGIGKQYDISGSQVYYAGGGGGGSLQTLNGISSGGQGGGGSGNDGINYPSPWPTAAGSTPAQGATPAFGLANRGGGGGAGGSYSSGNSNNYAGHGGPGIVIVKY